MKISSREKNLLILLLCVLLGYGYYALMYVPQRAKVEELKIERNQKNQVYAQMEDMIRKEGNIDLELRENRNEISKLSMDFFGDIDQEEAIVVLSDFARDSKAIFNRINFAEPLFEAPVDTQSVSSTEEANIPVNGAVAEESISENIRRLSSQIEFEGDYNSLMNLLKSMKNHPKNILSTNMTINADEYGNLNGNIEMEFYSVLSVDKYNSDMPSILTYRYIGRSPQLNPFSSYLWARTPSPSYSGTPGIQTAQGSLGSSIYQGGIVNTGYNVNPNTGQNNIHTVYGSGDSKDTYIAPAISPIKGTSEAAKEKEVAFNDKYSIQMIAFDRESIAQNYIYILEKQMMENPYYIQNGKFIVYHGIYNSFAEALNDLESLKRYSKDAYIVKLDESQIKAYEDYKQRNN